MSWSLLCLVCNTRVGFNPRNASLIHSEYTPLGASLASVLTDVLEVPLPEKTAHSQMLCKKCTKTCVEYEAIKNKLETRKKDILTQFKNTLSVLNLDYDNYGKETDKVPAVESKVGKKIVLPASKLQPLPPDYVIKMGKIESLSPLQMGLPKITSVTSQSTAAKATAPVKIAPKITQPTPKETNTTSIDTNAMTSVLNTDTSSVLSFNLNLPKNFLSMAKDKEVMKKEVLEIEFENNDQSMDIDEECTLVRVSEENVLNNEANSKEAANDSTDKSHYIDVGLMPLAEGSDAILEELVLERRGDGEGDEQTIVMAGEDGNILRVMTGQKIVYDGGEISFLAEDDNSIEEFSVHDNDNPDSNDESQIELQVSGDEETANAIIAAAQEQGGAFIKVESGEMYRVKSVQSKSVESYAPLQIVAEDGDQFRCLICDRKEDPLKTPFVADAESLMAHLKSEHHARVYICQICKKIVRKRSDYTAHIEEHAAKCNKILTPNEKSKVHECNICKKKYNSRTFLLEHMNVHAGVRPHVCSICGKAFASKYTHQAHLKTHLERPRPFKCSQCPKSFLTQQNLSQHEKTHSRVKDFVCNVCGKAFGTQHNLEVHGIVHSGAKPFVCGVCGKGFARRAEIRDHMRTHTGERPFSCAECGATFAQRSNLHSHRRSTHLGDRRYHCTQCPKKFKRKRLLDYHVKGSHTGERPLQCGVCRATFVYPEHYKKHARIHSGEKPYVCEVCGKQFNSRDNRNTHRFVHSDKKPYECLVCGAGYMRKQLLYAHMNTSGHLAESIVVNQPRVQKIAAQAQATAVESVKNKTDGLDTLFKTPEEMEVTEVKAAAKSAIKLVQASEGDEQSFITIHNIDGSEKPEATLLQSITAEQLEQAQVVASDGNGDLVRLVQIQLDDGNTGWVAINQ